MILKKLGLAIACTAIFALPSCSDDKEDDGLLPGSAVLSDGNWKIIAQESINTMVVDGAEVKDTTDAFASQPYCRQDNEYHFGTDNFVHVYDAAVKCSLDDPDTSSIGKWTIIEDGKLRIFTDTTETIYDIIYVNPGSFQVRTNVNTEEMSSILTTTYKHVDLP